MAELLTTEQVASQLGLDEQMIVRFRKQRKIPSIKLGYRTFRFQLPKVLAALEKLEIKAIKVEGAR